MKNNVIFDYMRNLISDLNDFEKCKCVLLAQSKKTILGECH